MKQKRNYLQPEMAVVKVAIAHQLLAGSSVPQDHVGLDNYDSQPDQDW